MRVIYVVHSYNNHAGTEEHTKLLAKEILPLLAGGEVAILYPERGSLHLLSLNSGETTSFAAEPASFPVTNYSSQKVDAALLRALDHFNPDLIHLQHFFNWPLSVLDIVLNYGPPCAITFHDYYCITPFFTMQGAPTAEAALSPDYVRSIFGADISAALIERKSFIAARIPRFAARFTPSHYLKAVLSDAFGGAAGPFEAEIITHGIEPFPIPIERYRGDNFAFGVVGGLLPQKGWRTVIEPFLDLRSDFPGISLAVYGGGEELPRRVPEGISFHGLYTQSELPKILSEFSVGIIPSLFAETFCLVLSELWQARIPVCASKIGALAERISHGENGYLFEPGDSNSIYEALRYFLTEDSWREWRPPVVKSAKEMALEYSNRYKSLINR